MKLFGWLNSLFDDADTTYFSLNPCESESTLFIEDSVSNPANGLPMIGGVAGIDVMGNLYGTDSLCDSSWDSTTHGCGISDFGGDW
jgi:hypothetical protein